MIFYFSATGNSLYVAKHLSKQAISIPQAIHDDRQVYTDDEIGFVFPIFAGEPPRMVIEFLKSAQFQATYIYMIMTYGMDESDAPEYTHCLCKELGLSIDYINTIKMVDNYLPSFDMSKEIALDKQEDIQLQAVIQAIKERKKEIPKASFKARKLHQFVKGHHKRNPHLADGKQIQVNEDVCVGCGICAHVCPLGIFKIKDGLATRSEDVCEFCLACAQNCPQKAIIMKYGEKNEKARYRHPSITLQEIINSNNQLQ